MPSSAGSFPPRNCFLPLDDGCIYCGHKQTEDHLKRTLNGYGMTKFGAKCMLNKPLSANTAICSRIAASKKASMRNTLPYTHTHTHIRQAA